MIRQLHLPPVGNPGRACLPLLVRSLTGTIPEALADLIYLTSITLRSNMLTVRAEKAGQGGRGTEAERSEAEERKANKSRAEEGAGAKGSRAG